MFFTEQALGDLDVITCEAAISRCIVAKILDKAGKLPADYEFYHPSFFKESYYSLQYLPTAIIETVDEALNLLGLGSVSLSYIDDGYEVHFQIPGIQFDDFSELIDNGDREYVWMADLFLDENEEMLERLESKDEFSVKLTEFEILPHSLLKNIMDLIGSENR